MTSFGIRRIGLFKLVGSGEVTILLLDGSQLLVRTVDVSAFVDIDCLISLVGCYRVLTPFFML